jgi:ketosteroid isomerase-like protein
MILSENRFPLFGDHAAYEAPPMKRLPVGDEDRRSVADWFARWGDLVADVNFKATRPMFAEDAIAFGSKVEMVTSQAALEREQWRAVWPTIEDYRYDLSTLQVVISPDRLMAMGAVIFRSTGLHQDGRKFERNGRCTVTLMRPSVGAPWVCTHSHVSLKPGTPAPSHGNRPERM